MTTRTNAPRLAARALLASMLLGTASLHAATDDPLLATGEQDVEDVSRWTPFADAWIGYDRVSGLPNGRANLERVRGRVRAGAIFSASPSWDIIGAVRGALGSDANRDNRRNNDNERSDSIGLDRLLARWRPGENTRIDIGKAPLPLELTPMLWDTDLRPAGVAIDHSLPLGGFSRVELVAGYFSGQELYGNDVRVGAAQAAWRWREGAPAGAGVLVSYLDFGDIGELVRDGLARTNSVVAGRFANDYRMLDVQLVGRAGLRGWPLEARLDLVRNLGADDARDGVRASLVGGDRLIPRGWEVGYAYQRIEKDAVLAAFNSDDWWFHSATRGHLAWVGYGIDETWNLRLAGFRERRDGLDRHTNRVRLDLAARW